MDSSSVETDSQYMPTAQEAADFRAEYARRRPQYERVQAYVRALLEDYKLSTDAKGLIHSVKSRIKTDDSLLRKAARDLEQQAEKDKKDLSTLKFDPKYAFSRVRDIVGLRVVCNSLGAMSAVTSHLRELGNEKVFRVDRDESKIYRTGYRSHHFIVGLSSEKWPIIHLTPSDLDSISVEIQVRTILEEAWGEIEHRIVYKRHYKIPKQLENGFVALSYRLNAADLSVERLVRRAEYHEEVEKPARPRTVRSIPMETEGLEMPHNLRTFLEERLREGEQKRADSLFDDALHIHEALVANVPLWTSLPQEARVDLYCEIGLDHLMDAWKKQAEHGELTPEAHSSLQKALDAYQQAEDAEKSLTDRKRSFFIPWRRSRIFATRGEFDKAAEEAELALQRYRENGTPAFIRHAFYPAEIHSRLGSLLMEVAMRDKNKELERKAKSHLLDAVRELEQKVPTPETIEAWSHEFVTAQNNLAYFYFETRNYSEAKEAIEAVKGRVSGEIWEHDIYFLDTRLAVHLAKLRSEGTFGIDALVELDALRSQLLEILLGGDQHVGADDVGGMLARIRECDALWRQSIHKRFGLKEGTSVPSDGLRE